MLHKNATKSSHGLGPTLVESADVSRKVEREPASHRFVSQQRPGVHLDLVRIASRRCSSFFAEAAVLVLVFGNLDYFLLKGRVDLRWIAGIFLAALALLAGSIFTEARAQRWIDAHP